MNSAIEEYLHKNLPKIIELRRTLHQYPELAFQEYKTTEQIKKYLLECNATLMEDVLPTGAVAIFGNGKGKTVLVREDIDALPMKEQTNLPFSSCVEDVCHSCGHDIHTAAMLLLAKGLSASGTQLNGTVILVFQPAEEIGQGAHEMIKSGLMERLAKIDAVIGFHVDPSLPAGKIGLIRGPADASTDKVLITVCGEGGHGAHPYRCADPITTAGYLLTQLQTIISRENPAVQPAVLTFGMISGGSAPNIIPTEVHLEGTLRAFNETGRHKMWDAIERVSNACCQAMRATAKVEIEPGAPVLKNDSGIADALAGAAQEVLEQNCVVWAEYPSPGSDDFAYFLEYAPGVQFRVGTANEDYKSSLGLHNPENIYDESAIFNGAIVMLDYILKTCSNLTTDEISEHLR